MQTLKKYTKLAGFGMLSFALSTGLLYGMLVLLAPKVTQEALNIAKPKNVTVVKAIQSDDAMLKQFKYETECLQNPHINDKNVCYKKKKHMHASHVKRGNVSPPHKSALDEVWHKVKSSHGFIQWVYGISILTLFLQMMTYLVVRHYSYEDLLRIFFVNNRDTIGDWTTSTAAIIGVLGTIFAFGSYAMSASSSIDLMEAFRVNVFDSIATTLIGGMAYILNLLLNIPIQMEPNYENKT